MDSTEKRARREALARFAEAWGNEFDENDESDQAALQQFVVEIRARMEQERANVA